MVTLRRKGTVSIASIPPDVLAQLNRGEIEASTLAENLAMDFRTLLKSVRPAMREQAERIDPKAGITKRMVTAARILLEDGGGTGNHLSWLQRHPSDVVRGWGAYLIAEIADLSLQDRIERMLPFAADAHFGVREWSWLSLRPLIAASPNEAIEILAPLTKHSSENVRRFASEAIRPRGVWSVHIKVLKSTPELALPILAPLKSDRSRYVQDSVGNWLNDAWKSSPTWVEALCQDWKEISPTAATTYIVRRALRNQRT